MDQSQRKKSPSVFSGLIWRFGERIIAQSVSFIVSLILARLLAPEDYGAIAIILVFIEIANVFIISGLTTSLIQKKEVSSLEMSTVFYCNVALSIVLYLILFFSAPLIAQIYSLPILIPATRVFALQIPIMALQSYATVVISRELNFRKFFFGNIIGTVASAVVGILMAYKGFGVWALVGQTLTQVFVSTLVLTVIVGGLPKLQFSLKSASPLIRYGWKVLCSEVIASVANQFSALMIGVRYTTSDLAFYTKGKQLPHMIRGNLYNTLVSVLFPAMSRVGDDSDAVKKLAKRSVRLLFFVACPLMIGLGSVSYNLVLVLYTEKWLPMTPFIWIICIECLLAILPTISLQALKAVGRSDVVLKLEFIKKAQLILSILIAMRFGVLAIAITLPLNTLFDVLVTGFCSKKIFGYGTWEQIKDCLPAAAFSVVMFVAVTLLGFLPIPPLPLLILQILCGGICYVALSAGFKNPEFAYLWQIIRTKFLHREGNK